MVPRCEGHSSARMCTQVADAGAAFERFREMQASGVAPNAHTFGALLHACAQIGNHTSAERVVQLMAAAGVAPCVEACTSLLDACVKAGTPQSLARAFAVRCALNPKFC